MRQKALGSLATGKRKTREAHRRQSHVARQLLPSASCLFPTRLAVHLRSHSAFYRHAGKNRHPGVFEISGFRVALAIASLPGMTIELYKKLLRHRISSLPKDSECRLLKNTSEARRNPRARARENVIESSARARNMKTTSSESGERTLRPCSGQSAYEAFSAACYILNSPATFGAKISSTVSVRASNPCSSM